MFRFSIRELMLVTLVVATGIGWFCHWRSLEKRYQEQAATADSYCRACEQLRSGAESMDGMLIQMGFEIETQGGRKSYTPPPGMPPLASPPAGAEIVTPLQGQAYPREGTGDDDTPPPSLKTSLEGDRLYPALRRVP